MNHLAGRRLLVAGEARTAGAVAEGASAQGGVAVVAVDTSAGGRSSTPAGSIPYDGGSEGDVERALELAFERLHGVDGLIVAVEATAMPPLDAIDPERWHHSVTRPLRTVFWLLRRSVHEWLASGDAGPVVMIVTAELGDGGMRSASIIEQALLSLARSLAKEYGRLAISCNVVAGGPDPAGQRAAVDAALFLVSPAASFVTGECLRVGADASERP
jgi:3-oxoacyl-[acyl-carrier protein] reductase